MDREDLAAHEGGGACALNPEENVDLRGARASRRMRFSRLKLKEGGWC